MTTPIVYFTIITIIVVATPEMVIGAAASAAAAAATASNGGSDTVASVSTRVCHEAASVAITCSFVGPPPFGTSASSLQLVKYLSHKPFTASNPTEELVDFTGSPASQPFDVVDTASWQLRRPWSSYAERYNQTVTHNDTSVTFHILSAVAEDSGYYGCKLNSAFSTFKPLLVYAKDISVNVTFLYGSSSSTPIVGGELSIEYDTMRSQFVEVAVKIEGVYASLPFSARLFTGRNVSQYIVVSPLTDPVCKEPELCVWTVGLMVQIVLSDVGQLHLDQLTLSVARPGQPDRLLWRRRARLVDNSQRLDIVAVRGVACAPPASADIRVRHGRPVTVACSVPRLWLSLPGYAAYWSVESAVQFYPVGRVKCAYPSVGDLPPGADYVAADADMVDPPGVAGACLGNKFRNLLDANFVARDDRANARVEYAFRIPAAYYVHAGRKLAFGVTVGVDKFAQKPLPERRYGFVVEEEKTSSACCLLPNTRATLLTPVLLLLTCLLSNL